jgi:hypothetical protein
MRQIFRIIIFISVGDRHITSLPNTGIIFHLHRVTTNFNWHVTTMMTMDTYEMLQSSENISHIIFNQINGTKVLS